MPESDEGAESSRRNHVVFWGAIQPNPGAGCKPRLLPDAALTIPVMLSKAEL